jgi:ABC-type Fe3+-hydroxamate transport system substrate-binding protein
MDKIQDAIGTWHTPVDIAAPRIVSLVPSLTELVCDLGLSKYLVGRTGFCIHPHEVVQTIPKIGGTKDVNIEKIRRLAPTHLIVNIDENEKPCVDKLAQFVPNIVVTHPKKLVDNLELFKLLGFIFNATGAAQQLADQFNQAQAALKKSVSTSVVTQRVLYCIWKDPWMTVSATTYIADMLAQIRWQVVHSGDPGYPEFTWSDQLLDNVDLILLSSEPYRFTEQHVDSLEKQTGKPVMLVDGEMISWYGSRSIAGMHYLNKLAVENN